MRFNMCMRNNSLTNALDHARLLSLHTHATACHNYYLLDLSVPSVCLRYAFLHVYAQYIVLTHACALSLHTEQVHYCAYTCNATPCHNYLLRVKRLNIFEFDKNTEDLLDLSVSSLCLLYAYSTRVCTKIHCQCSCIIIAYTCNPMP